MVKCSIYQNERLIEIKWFYTVLKANAYCKYILPKIYGFGNYYYVIWKS